MAAEIWAADNNTAEREINFDVPYIILEILPGLDYLIAGVILVLLGHRDNLPSEKSSYIFMCGPLFFWKR